MPTWTTEDSIPTTPSLPCSDMVLTLTGFMGSGKTTTGKILAERLGCAFLDLDQVIEEAKGMTIPEIFATQGEATFRAAELEALEELLEQESKTGKIDLVLALGGGTLMTPECERIVREKTLCVYLKASVDTLVQNLEGTQSTRPMLGGQDLRTRIEALLEEREETYARCAEITVENNESPLDELIPLLHVLDTELEG